MWDERDYQEIFYKPCPEYQLYFAEAGTLCDAKYLKNGLSCHWLVRVPVRNCHHIFKSVQSFIWSCDQLSSIVYLAILRKILQILQYTSRLPVSKYTAVLFIAGCFVQQGRYRCSVSASSFWYSIWSPVFLFPCSRNCHSWRLSGHSGKRKKIIP